METTIIVVIIAAIVFALILLSGKGEAEKKKREEVENAQNIADIKVKRDAALENMRGLIRREFTDPIMNGIKNQLLEYMDEPDYNTNVLQSMFELAHRHKIRLTLIKERFSTPISERLFAQEHWIGMSEEMLLCSKGSPDETESTAIKTVYIYGSKSNGDVFEIENNLVTKIIDR